MNSLLIDGQTVAGRRVKDFCDVTIFEKFFEASTSEKLPVDSGSEKVDEAVICFYLNEAKSWKCRALK